MTELQGKTILIIDDDANLCEAMAIVLLHAGANVRVAHGGRSGLKLFFKHHPDLTILDIRMPEMDGWEVLRQIRSLFNNPIILLTTLNSNEAIVRGLDGGSDDFISKPFDNHVLLARARAVLRRAQPIEESIAFSDSYLSIDLNSRQVFAAGEQIRLTSTEYRILAYLLQNAKQVLTYQQILEHVWGLEYRDSIDYVHVYLSHLRRKLEKDPRNPRYLVNEHGVGYRFERRQNR